MEPVFFEKPAKFREWLQANHTSQTELLVGFYKTGTGRASITWPQSVDEALCFGWIDGVRRSLGPESYTIRFTPRKPGSIWSAVNINKVEALIKSGLMQPAGLAAYAKRTEEKSRIYSFENEAMKFSAPYLKAFKVNKKAWAFFEAQAPWYKKTSIHRVMTAKQEKTKESRLQALIKASEEGRRT
ncbi:bacteriocin-protection protein [Mucilaginibacter pallidiroseus]|uniref:Bacteriocin-protection protein n=1 Tax=Mucilaginibacter pallidiroseus TaxID=2599295 RepID=A0A563U377_9SPHI|nr:YdeI/OmpD-associated family protein [Mucilaginibacter pallidiroseus]TWR25790.1 bacteriocin-protection protein [Mucilaginibacter pallidiroseus]